MRRPLVPALVCAALLLNGVCAALAGEIEGTVTIKSPLRVRATGKSLGMGIGYGSDDSADDVPPPLTREQEVPYVVVSVVGAKNLAATPKTFVMRQKGREFTPHVLAIPRGSSVVFTNEDPFYHSIYSESSGGRFSLPKYARGKKAGQTFDTPGPIELFCGIHSRMNAYIYVAESDWYTQPGADRRFTLRNLPAGTYTLQFWHPRATPRKQTVTVPSSGAVRLDVTL